MKQVLIALAASAAIASPLMAQDNTPGTDMGDLVYATAQKMIDHYPRAVTHGHPIVVTTIVSVDDLGHSSSFGREASELVLSKLAGNGYLVQDITYMRALEVNPRTGAMALSRKAWRLARDQHAQAVVVGTYAVGGRQIYVSLRTLDATTGTVLSTADVEIPNNPDTSALLTESYSTGPIVKY